MVLRPRVQLGLGWLRERVKALWDAFEIKKTWPVIVGVALVLIPIFLFPFVVGGRREGPRWANDA